MHARSSKAAALDSLCCRYARADIFEEAAGDPPKCSQLLQHASAFTPPPPFLAQASALPAQNLALPQFYRDRALSLMMASTLKNTSCRWSL